MDQHLARTSLAGDHVSAGFPLWLYKHAPSLCIPCIEGCNLFLFICRYNRGFVQDRNIYPSPPPRPLTAAFHQPLPFGQVGGRLQSESVKAPASMSAPCAPSSHLGPILTVS